MARGDYSRFYSTFTKLHRNRHLPPAGGFILGTSILKLFGNPDGIDTDMKTVTMADYQSAESGMDRISLMFRKDEFGHLSPELEMVSQGALMGFFTGSILGGTMHSKENYLKFFEKNQSTVFHNHLDAQKRLQDKVFLGFFRGGWMWGWRLGLFTGSITFLTTTISVYRGKSSLLEYIAGGAITGTLYKFKQGPKGMVAGGLIGGMLGTIAGSISLTIMYLTGTSMEDVRYWQYKWKEEHNEKKLQKLRKLREQDADVLVKCHEESSTNDLLEMLDNDNVNNSNTPLKSEMLQNVDNSNTQLKSETLQNVDNSITQLKSETLQNVDAKMLDNENVNNTKLKSETLQNVDSN